MRPALRWVDADDREEGATGLHSGGSTRRWESLSISIEPRVYLDVTDKRMGNNVIEEEVLPATGHETRARELKRNTDCYTVEGKKPNLTHLREGWSHARLAERAAAWG